MTSNEKGLMKLPAIWDEMILLPVKRLVITQKMRFKYKGDHSKVGI